MSETPTLFDDGAAYERLMGRWSRRAGEKFLDWLAAPNHLRWLDVGCGNGAFTEVLMARCAPAEVTGVDPSDGQLAYARTRAGTKGAQFRVADAQALPFAENSFDAATMALVIAFVPDPLKAAKELARVVKPTGLVATYMWDFDNGGFPLHPVARAMRALGLPMPPRPSIEASRVEVMRGLWQQAGLQAVETDVIRIEVAYADFEDFWESNTQPVGPSGKALADLPPAAREALKTRLRHDLRQDQYIAADGRIAYQSFANAVKGRVA